MPDLFDNFFNKIGQTINGKNSHHYTGASQVNTGRYYNYHENGTNNKYWMPTGQRMEDKFHDVQVKPTETEMKHRNDSVASTFSESSMPMSRNNSVSDESRNNSVSE